MENGKCKISPWMVLLMQRHKARNEHRHEWLRRPKDVERAIRKKRKEYLGSGLSLEMFVREDERPLEDNVVVLSRYLGKRTAAFLASDNRPDNEDLCTDFFYYSLQLYAHGMIGDDSVDDLIQLAEVYERDPEILGIIGDDDLPEELAKDLRYWLMENDRAPANFVTATIGALAVFLGVLPDPIEEENT